MRTLVLAAAAAALLAPPAAAHHRHAAPAPSTIPLPAGVQPEGIAPGPRGTFLAGSLADGTIWRGSLRTGRVTPLVTAPAVPQAAGLATDARRGLLVAAGGQTGRAAVYDLRTGSTIAALELATGTSFINDAIVTRRAAWLTNSYAAELYRVPLGRHGGVGAPETVRLTGPAAELVDGINLNGIEATRDGRWLISVNLTTGRLFRIDARTGASIAIDLDGASLTGGDGLWLTGRTLYVVRNSVEEIAVLRLDRRLARARLVRTITSPLFEVPTTMAVVRGRLLVVNAQFGLPQPNPYEIVVLPPGCRR